MSAAMWEAATILKQSTHREERMYLHCFTGDVASYSSWMEMFPNSIVTGKTIRTPGYADMARHMDVCRLLLETDSPMLSRGHISGHQCDA